MSCLENVNSKTKWNLERRRHGIAASPALPVALVLMLGWWLGTAAETLAQPAGQGKEIVAYVDQQPIERQELEAHLEGPLRQLEVEKQQLLERGLAELVEQRLLSLEAGKRGVAVGQLLADEVQGKITVDTAAVDAFFAANQARIGQPKEQVAPQIRRYLEQQEAQRLRTQLLAGLRDAHDVSLLLEPYRASLPAAKAAPMRGSDKAPVTLTVFSDFQCPGCRSIEPVLDAVRDANGDKLNLVFRQYPLTSIHPQAFQAAEAALCAGDQGQFWQMHASLFADQRRLNRADLDQRAETLGLDSSAFAACLDAGDKKQVVEDDMRLGRELGISGTPTLFVNGRPVTLGQSPQDAIQALIEDELRRSAG